MKALIFSSILIPFFTKRAVPELSCLVTFLCIPMLWCSWDIPNPSSIGVMTDKVSGILLILTLWTSSLMLLLKPNDKWQKFNILILMWSLLSFFMVSSVLAFFILFEMSLIPTLCLILGWGYQPERLEASLYFLFYTISFSIPLLTSLLWLVSTSGGKYFYFNSAHEVCSSSLGFYMLLVFMIKLPLFMTHLWLPKAHVEAPVVGSMILAGVLLKTGGYGVIRVFPYLEKTLVTLGYMVLSLIGMVYICLVCLYCTDMKQLIAYSSVSHMNFMVVGLMNNSHLAYSGSMIMMISHGLCSSLMFMLTDFVYKRSNTRSVLVNKGLLMVVPFLSMLWGLTILFNMGTPPTPGSLSELLIISASNSYNSLYKLGFILYLFLSAFYSVFLYMTLNHGVSSKSLNSMDVKEFYMSALHLVPLTGLPVTMKLMLL